LRSGVFTSEFSPELQILSTAIFCKEKASIFSNESIIIWLKDNKITEIEIIGVDGNSYVAISAIEVHKRGYDVILPCRYIGIKNKKDKFLEKKEELRKTGIIICE